MTYIPGESKVVYRSKDDKKGKTFDALEWLAAMCSYVPNEQTGVSEQTWVRILTLLSPEGGTETSQSRS